ncbi:DUF483 domain-containing protein [Candidatus Woesearchaeota archaeon]|jgi:hypothetical protein|nr:DUF483 domain-containing protein [Candidatus Woesearchaeota archaeon]MBT6519302.1 DUF483 domain-containing protein [Candidatus Woesearchaeota archaeon]MBT7368955.1 DUF483 domain-containing protein [Candidatus Woesearchaeota archaeon]
MSDKNKLIKECKSKFKLVCCGVDLLAVFENPMDAINVYFAHLGLKPVSRFELVISDDVLIWLSSACEKLGLHFVYSDFLVGDKRFVYFSKDLALVEKAKVYESNQDDYNLGLLLGYPECCARFYMKNYGLAEQFFHKDHTIITMQNSESASDVYFGLNYLLRFFGLLLIDFYPCSFQCGCAIDIANGYFDSVCELNSEFADWLKEKLSLGVYYSNETGVHVFEHCKFNSSGFDYSGVLLTSENSDHKLFNKGNKIVISDSGNIGSEIIVRSNLIEFGSMRRSGLILFNKH